MLSFRCYTIFLHQMGLYYVISQMLYHTHPLDGALVCHQSDAIPYPSTGWSSSLSSVRCYTIFLHWMGLWLYNIHTQLEWTGLAREFMPPLDLLFISRLDNYDTLVSNCFKLFIILAMFFFVCIFTRDAFNGNL